MNTIIARPSPQPDPFTPGVTKIMVKQHAYEMFADKFPAHALTLEDWKAAEKDLLMKLETEFAFSA